MYLNHLVPKWKWPIWDVKKTYQPVPNRDWPNQEVVEMYQVAYKWDQLIWDFKRTCQVMPKKDGSNWDVTKSQIYESETSISMDNLFS